MSLRTDQKIEKCRQFVLYKHYVNRTFALDLTQDCYYVKEQSKTTMWKRGGLAHC